MSIEKIVVKVSNVAKKGLDKAPEYARKADCAIEKGSKKLQGSLDALSQNAKAKISSSPKLKQTLKKLSEKLDNLAK